MRILNFILAVVFLLFAFVQVNDPDAALWILIYGYVSVTSVFGVFKFYPRRALALAIIACIIYLVILLPGVLAWLKEDDKTIFFDQMQDDKPYIEESREFFGLLLAIIALVFHLIMGIRQKRTQSQ